MDYNDQLWVKKLQEMKRGGKMGPSFHMSIENKTFSVSDGVEKTAEELRAGVDRCEGTPQEQLKKLFMEKAESLIRMIDETVGWPAALGVYEKLEVHVELTGGIPKEEDEDDWLYGCYLCD